MSDQTAQPAAGPDDDGYVVGVDLGGTGTRFVALDASRRRLARSAVQTPANLEPDDAGKFLAVQIESLIASDLESAWPSARLLSVGIGASGPVTPEGTIENEHTLRAFSYLDLAAQLQRIVDVPVVIRNDAVTAAIAEHRIGAADGSPSFLHVTVGTGIGTCLLVDGRPVRGGDGWHPEGGHLSVNRMGAACYCGRIACWEQSASRSALQQLATTRTGRRVHDLDQLDRLATAADRGDPIAIAVFDDYGERLAEGIGTLLGLYRPLRVVIGGSGARYFPQFAANLGRALRPLAQWIPEHTIAATTLDDFGGAIGAAMLALDETTD